MNALPLNRDELRLLSEGENLVLCSSRVESRRLFEYSFATRIENDKYVRSRPIGSKVLRREPILQQSRPFRPFSFHPCEICSTLAEFQVFVNVNESEAILAVEIRAISNASRFGSRRADATRLAALVVRYCKIV